MAGNSFVAPRSLAAAKSRLSRDDKRGYKMISKIATIRVAKNSLLS